MSEYDQYKEIEYKYRVEADTLYRFKELVMKGEIPQYNVSLLLESGDKYYIRSKGDEDFLRLRYAQPSKKPYEITYKNKLKDRSDNIIRDEINLCVSSKNTIEDCEAFISSIGYNHLFTIEKLVTIFRYNSVDIPFYSVTDKKTNKTQFFMEIESLNISLEDIQRWEKHLSSLGLGHRNRLQKSLFEIYKGDHDG